MTDRPVLAAQHWPSNGHMIEDCVRLGYLRPEWKTLDPTFGLGNWWTRWRPDTLITRHRAVDGSDFRKLDDLDDGTFDAIAYDPPYVCPGGRDTSTIKSMHAAYGMADPDFRTPGELQAIVNDGLTEMVRLIRPRRRRVPGRRGGDPGGIILAKCKNYVWGGHVWVGTHHLLTHAVGLGCEMIDRLEHVGKASGPQPGGRTRRCPDCKGASCGNCTDGRIVTVQQHAARNLSTLFVFRAPRLGVIPHD